MAGANKTLKEGQVLFKAGDQSDGMYLVRKGELRVFLEQNGKEVMLASIGAGGMIGEMALFDNSPRSASVKAVTNCEITQISNDDFAKLMKQIPKWFVSLMAALSGRLRQTNERLRKLEAATTDSNGTKTQGKPYQTLLRQLNILILVWAKDGVRDGKEMTLLKALIEKQLIECFEEETEKVQVLFEILIKQKVLSSRLDQYKNVVLTAPNRHLLNALPEFIQSFLKNTGGKTSLPDSGLSLLRVLQRLVLRSPYDSITVALPDIEKEAARDGLDTTEWQACLPLLKSDRDDLKLVKAANGVGFKTSKKDIAQLLRLHEILAALYKANLS